LISPCTLLADLGSIGIPTAHAKRPSRFRGLVLKKECRKRPKCYKAESELFVQRAAAMLIGLFVRPLPSVLLGKTSAKSGDSTRTRSLAGQRVRLLDGVSQAGKESYTGLTAPHVAFQFLAQRVIQCAVQIV